jgi:nicotinate-nucleotide adenylyltransferase
MLALHTRRLGWPCLPPHAPGMRIGLLGGSFNPPHAAHLLISLRALKRLGLDAVWWLVTPGNPLKDNRRLPPIAERAALARAMAAHPRIVVTTFEAEAGLVYTVDTIAYLRMRAPQIRFVWLMGADNLVSFHRWQGWREIARMVPIAVFDRPGATLKALDSPAAQVLARFRVDESQVQALFRNSPPCWTLLHGPRSTLSSTALRQAMS